MIYYLDQLSSLLVVGIALGCLFAGCLFGFLFFKWSRQRLISRAQDEANELIQEAKDQVEIEDLERQEKIQEIESNAWAKVDADILKTEERIEDLQEKADEKKQKNDLIHSQARQKLVENDRELKAQEDSLKQAEKQFEQRRETQKQKNTEFINALHQKLGTQSEEVKNQIVQSLLAEAENAARKFIEDTEEDIRQSSEARAKQMLDTALNRFARPYCAERGIGAAHFPDAQVRAQFCDAKGDNIKAVQEVCGCDLVIMDGSDMVGVAGFDPVRRELTRRTLEKIFKEKKAMTPESIKRIGEAQKKELLRQIKSDGDAVAKELRLESLHPEVRQMLGSLRYRYSFTQNQHFHCAEVGWLCGLLSAELNLELRQGRRAGLLHDIGKSMDHAAEGGHAVIGANFIQARNESPEIVHAVRSHHYDEQPNSDLAFLVIAADAISGARPGARRSTIESYNQKVSELQDIARRYAGVTDAYVLSGGRELRAFVNSKKVDDAQALEMSRQMAAAIEEECSYPGQIKVVIVRETLVTENTLSGKSHN